MIGMRINDVTVRFLIAGGSAAMLTWLLRFPLGHIMPYAEAVLTAQAIGMAYGFVTYRKWVFTERADRPLLHQIADFTVVNLAGAAVTVASALVVNAALVSLAAPLAFAEALAHAAGIGAGAAVNFLGHKHATFRRRPATGNSA